MNESKKQSVQFRSATRWVLCAFILALAICLNTWQNIDAKYRTESQNILQKHKIQLRRYLIGGKLKLSSSSYEESIIDLGSQQKSSKRENATLLMLVRNWEIEGALASMHQLEEKFNSRYHYDWTFMNDVPFTDEFIEATSAMASGHTQYALIPSRDWDIPLWINRTHMEKCMSVMESSGVLYGGSESYRNMCRFNSGYFFRQKILDSYDYYMRVEPFVQYFCDFPYDPFQVMRLNNKKYGFVIAIYEYEDTIPTLWSHVEEYLEKNSLDDNETLDFITDKSHFSRYLPIVESTTGYNLCHFWSNFEVGDLNWFRSDEYIQFFTHLEKTGGFYYERWGDAPVHSIIASALLKPDEIIHFDEIGYSHPPYETCPHGESFRQVHNCQCNPNGDNNIDISQASCLMKWWKNGHGKSFLRPKTDSS